MNRNLCREIVGFLRIAGPVEDHLRRLRNIQIGEWESALQWMSLSGIALVFYDRLQKLGAEDTLPRGVRSTLAVNLSHHRLRIAAMAQEFDSLNLQFERAGVEYAVWKGFALIPEYCPDACLRPTYDYDYLISQATLDAAQVVLQAGGYVRKADRGVQHSVNFTPPGFPARVLSSPGGVYAAALPRKVELHLKLWDEDAFHIPLRGPERPLDRRFRRTWQGRRFHALAEEDAFLFQALHTFQHILHNWCRLGWLWEIAYFIEDRSTDTSFWKTLSGHMGANELLTDVVALVISLASRLFYVAVPKPIKAHALNAMRGPIALWMNQYGLRSALDNFSGNKYALFLYREFVADEAAWRRIRRSRLLPLQRPNRVAGSAGLATSVWLPTGLTQGWYVVQRLMHHAVSAAGYVWESARWDSLRGQCSNRILL